MLVERRVLKGIDKLTEVDRTFLVLLGELANDLTNLSKLLAAADRDPSNPLEMQANAVLKLVLLKLLGARIWQSWELLRSFYRKKVLAGSSWLHGKSVANVTVGKLKQELPDGCVWDRLRDQFAYHCDSAAIGSSIAADVLGGQFDLIFSEQVTNSFFLSSEMAVWSAILRVKDDDAFTKAYPPLVEKAAELVGDLVGVVRELFMAFAAHVVNDLGGSLEVEASTTSLLPVPYNDAVLPLFGVCTLASPPRTRARQEEPPSEGRAERRLNRLTTPLSQRVAGICVTSLVRAGTLL
jgi:hypothetical protein